MKRTFLLAKIHRATVTRVEIGYEGSLSLDENLIKAAGLKLYEKVDVYNVSNGERFSTYVIKAPAGSREVGVFGAAGHKAHIGDVVIIAAYVELEEEEYEFFMPKILVVSEGNEIKEIR